MRHHRTWADLLALPRPALGTWSQLPAEECIDMLGAAGFDFTIVDMEHGVLGLETAERLFRACDANGLAPLARLARADPALVGQVLDAGAAAVVAPGVDGPDLARALVAASRFAPAGTRGACPCVRAGGHFVRDWRGHAAAQEAGTGVIALVESRAGLEAVEAIVAVEGLLALLIGPFDLSVSLGHAGDHLAGEVQDAIGRMIDAARARDLPVIVPVFDPDPARARAQRDDLVARGATLVVVGTDKILFHDAASRYGAALAGGPGSP